jgi:hypothetical protein
MKKFRKLIPAFVLLLISTAIMSTATFAWFSMNTQVTATGMQVTAKSDNTYLLINTGENDTAAEIQTANLTTIALTVEDADADVYPSSPALSAAQAAYLSVAEGHKTVAGTDISVAGVQVTNAATAEAVTNWYTATAATPGSSAMLAGTAKQLTAFTDYVIHKTIYLTLAVGSNNAENLTVTPTIALKAGSGGTDITGVKVLVVTSDGGFAVLDSDSVETDIKGSNTELTPTTVLTVDIYIYYDGEEDAVFTNNMANLAAATINLAFDVDAIPAA